MFYKMGKIYATVNCKTLAFNCKICILVIFIVEKIRDGHLEIVFCSRDRCVSRYYTWGQRNANFFLTVRVDAMLKFFAFAMKSRGILGYKFLAFWG